MHRKLFAIACALTLTFAGQGLAQSQPGGSPGSDPGGNSRAPDLFERLDRNHDGMLTPDELQDRGRAMLQRLGKAGVGRGDTARLRAQRRELRGRPDARLECFRERHPRAIDRLERLRRRHPQAFERLKERWRERSRRATQEAPALRRPGARSA